MLSIEFKVYLIWKLLIGTYILNILIILAKSYNKKKITYLDRLLDLSLFCSSSIIRLGEFDLLSWTSCRATGLLDLEDALPDLDRDFLVFGLPLPDFDRDLPLVPDFGDCERDFGLCDLDFGLWDRDFGLWDPDFGLWDLDFGLCDLDFGLCGPDFGLAERLLGLPDRALPDPERDLLEPLLDLEARCLGLPEALDLGLEDPDLLLCADPDRDLLECAGEFDLLLEALEALDDRLELAEWFDLGDSLPDLRLAGLRDTDLKLKYYNTDLKKTHKWMKENNKNTSLFLQFHGQ